MAFKTHGYSERVDAKMDYVKVSRIIRVIEYYLDMLKKEMDASVKDVSK